MRSMSTRGAGYSLCRQACLGEAVGHILERINMKNYTHNEATYVTEISSGLFGFMEAKVHWNLVE